MFIAEGGRGRAKEEAFFEQDGVSGGRGGEQVVALDPQHVLRRLRHRRLRVGQGWRRRAQQAEGRRAA